MSHKAKYKKQKAEEKIGKSKSQKKKAIQNHLQRKCSQEVPKNLMTLN